MDATARKELEGDLETARARVREAAAAREEAAGPFVTAVEELVEAWGRYREVVASERKARDAVVAVRRELGRRPDGQDPGPGRIPTGPRPALRQRLPLAARLDAELRAFAERGELP